MYHDPAPISDASLRRSVRAPGINPMLSFGTSMRTSARALLLLSGLVTVGCASSGFQPRPDEIPSLERATARAPQDGEMATRLGAAYYAAGRHDEARAVLQRVIAGGGEPAAYLYLGLASEALQDWPAARTAYADYVERAGTARARSQMQARLAIVAREEVRQLARDALAREAVLSQQPPMPNTIAVMPFAMSGLPEDLQPLRTALADMIITDLSYTSLRSVERVRMQSMLDEMVLAQAGYTTPETGARVGRLVRAQNVVQGLISGTEGRLALNTSVLDTEQRQARDVARSGQLDAIFELQKQLVYDILGALGIVATPQERDAINGNRTGNLIAFVAYGRGLEAMDRGDFSAAVGHFREAGRADPAFRAAASQRAAAEQVLQAPSAEQLTSIATLEIASVQVLSVTQTILDQVNQSPASEMTQSEPTTTQAPTSGEGAQQPKPGTQQGTQSPLQQGARATVQILIPNPRTGGGGNR
jgi:tetratricopeptide (TPR) repeat protein